MAGEGCGAVSDVSGEAGDRREETGTGERRQRWERREEKGKADIEGTGREQKKEKETGDICTGTGDRDVGQWDLDTIYIDRIYKQETVFKT